MKNAVTVQEALLALRGKGFLANSTDIGRLMYSSVDACIEVKKDGVQMDLPVLDVDGVPCVHMVTTKRRFESTQKLVFWCNAVVKAVSACMPKAEEKADWDVSHELEDWFFSPND